MASVYVLWAEGTSRFKVGYTKGAVDERAAQIMSMSPFPLRIVAEAQGGRKQEMAIHYALRPYRVHGEWFDLPEETVWWLFSEMGVDVTREKAIGAAQ